MSLVAAVQLCLIYMGGQMFRAFGLSVYQLVFVLVFAASLIPVESMRKMLINRRNRDTIKA